MADDILLTTASNLSGLGFQTERFTTLSRAGVPGLLARRHLHKKSRGRRVLAAGPNGLLIQRHLDRQRATDDPVPTAQAVAGMGDLGRFKFKRVFKSITKPVQKLGKIAQKTIAKNAGVLQAFSAIAPAFGPMGMAAGALIGAGTNLVMQQEQKKAERAAAAEARRAEAQQAAAAAAESPSYPVEPEPMPAWPSYQSQAPSWGWPDGGAPSEQPTYDADASELIVAGTPPPSAPMVYMPEVMAAPEDGDGEMPVMAGLGAAPAGGRMVLVTLAALGLGAWWLLRTPSRSNQ